ncbi:putative kinesin [Trypanosoma theileri]|uniref:Putative kinesin n=1 Tax=Trypanosoma theileri TaxID=67003 RepID=A0A1X0NNL3_9TRYP|nr:putative kinesin [Trypanosoma theileri]ORC86295.1 putative kinesin [Trypanosoma theileri]
MLRRQSSGPVLKSQPSPSCIHTEDDEVIREPSQNGSNHTNALGILVAVRIRPFTRQEKQWELKKQDDKEFDERHFLEPIVDVDNDGKTITLLDPTNRGVSKTKFNFEYVISSIAPSVEVDIFDDMNHEPMLPSPPPKQEIESQEGQAQYRRKGLLNGSPIMLTGENSDEEAELEQEKLFQALGVPLVDWSLRGFNACIFAYGQTGSGKTYTMMGNQSHEGLIPRVTRHLFNSIAEQATGQQRPHENEDLSIPGSPSGFSTSSKGEDGSSYNLTPSASPPTTGETPTVCLTKVTISFMEIHNERVWDLLKLERRKGWNGAGVANNNYNSRWDPDPSECYEVLKVRQHPIQGPFVEGLTTVDVSSWEECQKYINHGNSVRAHSCTSGNENSSRSHAIFQMVVTQTISLGGRVRGKEVTTQRVSKINLVDLAGSERNTNADVKGKHFTEANAINLSLSVLRRVITALVNRSKVVPYRESLLTYVLSDNFGGNSRTVMCANISPHISKFSETESTLRYAALARGVVNQVRVNEHPLAKVIRELRDRMRRLQEELRQSVEGGGEGKEKEVEVERVSELEARIARHAETLAEVRQRERDLCALVREARRRERDLRADLRRRREEGRRWRREAQRQREAKVRLLTALRDVARENPQLQLPGDVPITTSDTEDVDEIVNAEDEEEEEEEEEQEYGEEDLVDLGDDKIVECLGSGEGEGEEKEKKMNGVKGVHLPLTVRNRPASSSQLPRIAQTKVDESPFKNIDFTQRPQKKGQKEKQQQQPLNVDRLSEGGIKVSSAPPVIGKGRGGKTIKKGNSGNNKDSSTTECVIPHPPLLRRAGSDTVRPSSGILRPSQCAVPLSLQPSDDSEKEMGRHSSNDSPECVLAINGVNPHIIKGISLGGGRSPTPPLLQNHISPSSPPKRKKKNNRNDNISVDTILDIQTDFIVGENNSDKENHKRSLVNRPPPLHPRRLVETPFSKPESILSKKTPNSNSSNGSNPQKAYNRENGVVHNNLALLKKRDAVVVQRSTPLDKTRAMVRKG